MSFGSNKSSSPFRQTSLGIISGHQQTKADELANYRDNAISTTTAAAMVTQTSFKNIAASKNAHLNSHT